MRIWQRAYLYARRKAGKSILLLLVMLLLFSFVMIGMLLHRATDLAIQQTRQNLGGGFRIAPDMQNRENVMITEADGQTSVTYIGAPIDEALIQTVWARDGIDAYNAVLRGDVFLQEDLKLIDRNGIYQDDPIAAHLVSVEADTDPSLSTTFQRERVKLTNSGLSGESGAIISETLARENSLRVGDEIQLLPREGHEGTAVTVQIRGLFTVEAAQQNTDVAAPVHLLENKIFIDLASGGALMGGTGTDYVDFFISDPAQVYQIIDEIKAIEGIEWKCFAVTASVEEYEKVTGPLLSMRKLADTLLAIMAVASIAVLSLIQALFNKSRQHEMGIMLSVGISKTEILFQRFIETAMIAVAALALSVCVIFLIWPQMGKGIYENMSSIMGPLDAVSIISVFAITAGCGMLVLLLSTVLSSLGAMRLSPKEILSKLS
ncbi:MAG: FtsX-like permease family protein [Lachnospiraceae bacterium]|nr:FtsX-like permease family protein [Lachnospiraceae bacterium]